MTWKATAQAAATGLAPPLSNASTGQMLAHRAAAHRAAYFRAAPPVALNDTGG